MAALTHDVIKAHMEASIDASIQINNTTGWYSAAYSLEYDFQGVRIKLWEANITIGTHRSSPVPAGASNIALVVYEWWGFGWSTIFTQNWSSPVRFCADIWGTTLNPQWKEVSCG